MNGTNMWHFVYVLKSILFDRGEKAEEILLSEVNKIKSSIILETKVARNGQYEIRNDKDNN